MTGLGGSIVGYAGRGIHGQTVEALAQRVVRGDIVEGSLIDIVTLQAELGVSRTVLREALKVLGAKGMVDARQKRGTFVRPRASWALLDPDVLRWRAEAPTPDETLLAHLQELRDVIEPATARLAAIRATDDDLAVLARALQDMTDADGEPETTARADVAFHEGILLATRNELLEQMDVVLTSGLFLRDRVVHGHPDVDDPVPPHRAVYDAIAAHDPVAAEAAMRELLERASKTFEKLRASTKRRRPRRRA